MRLIRFYVLDIIPFMIIAAFIIVCIRYYKCKKSNSFSVVRELLIIVFWLYLSAMFLKTCVPADYLKFDFSELKFMLPTKEYIYNNPYQSNIVIRACVLSHRWFDLFNIFIVNLIMLLPFGFLFPIIYPKRKEYTIIIGIGISCLIEFIQLFLPRLTDTYDIFLNSIGVIIGYLIYKIAYRIKNKSRKR